MRIVPIRGLCVCTYLNLRKKDVDHKNFSNQFLSLHTTRQNLLLQMRSLLFSVFGVIAFGHEFTPPEPLPSIYASAKICIATYAECMQDLTICWRENRFTDLSICDVFQDKCESIYSRCKYIEIPLHWMPYEQTQTERCMTMYDDCLVLQNRCHHVDSLQEDKRSEEGGNISDCTAIEQTCQAILKTCDNPGAVKQPRPTGSSLSNYVATWTAPETSLAATPSAYATTTNTHCQATYQHCTTFYDACLEDVRLDKSAGETFDAEHRAKACYQILLRCKSDIPLCLAHPTYSSEPLETWLPDRVGQGVEVPPWIPSGIPETDGTPKCLGGYQRCLIMYRNCLLVATMFQEAGWFEKAEFHRNRCQNQLIPLCMNGLSVCEGLNAR